jgi:hypothetical protein
MFWRKKKAEQQQTGAQTENQAKKPQPKREHIVELFIQKAMEVAREEKTSHNWIFDVPGTENEAIFSLEIRGDKHIVAVMVRRKGSQYVTMHYKFNGSREEMIAYLRNPDNAASLVQSVWELSEAVDDKAGEYPFY